MAGKILYLAPVDHASGKILGAKQRFTAVHRTWGNKQRGCMVTTERNLTLKPYSQDEIAQHSAFAAAAAQRKLINQSPSLKNTWRAKFAAEQKAGTTKCTTLGGYLMSASMKGKIDDSGNPRS